MQALSNAGVVECRRWGMRAQRICFIGKPADAITNPAHFPVLV
jgi:hypothetical protein